jgi:hypothetical protein
MAMNNQIVKLTFTIRDAKGRTGYFVSYTDVNFIGNFSSFALDDLESWAQLIARALQISIKGQLVAINASIEIPINSAFVSPKIVPDVDSDVEELYKFVGRVYPPGENPKPYYFTVPTANHDAFFGQLLSRLAMPNVYPGIPSTPLQGIANLLEVLDNYDLYEISQATDSRRADLTIDSVQKAFKR